MKVGKKDVIFNETIFIPDGEFATFSYKLAEDDILNVKIMFNTDESDPNPRMGLDLVNEEFQLNFINFNSPAGHSNNAPVHFANSNKNEPIYLLAVINRFKSFIKIELQLMLEKAQ